MGPSSYSVRSHQPSPEPRPGSVQRPAERSDHDPRAAWPRVLRVRKTRPARTGGVRLQNCARLAVTCPLREQLQVAPVLALRSDRVTTAAQIAEER